MLGKDFWEDLDIDLIMIRSDIEIRAQQILQEYGTKLTEKDILKLIGGTDSTENGLEKAYSEAILSEYTKAGYTPIPNTYTTTVKKSIWQRIYAPVVQLVRTHRS
jgi:hypothetical protein